MGPRVRGDDTLEGIKYTKFEFDFYMDIYYYSASF